MAGSWRTSRRTAVIGSVVGGLLVVAGVGLGILWFVQRDAVLPNTSVAGIDVSGSSAEEVRTALAPTVEARETDPVVFVFEDTEHVMIPRETGFGIDVDATVDQALGRGRQGLPGDIVTRVRALREPADIDLVEVTDDDVVIAWVDDLADELDRPEITGGVTIDTDTAEVVVEASQGEVVVDRVTTVQLATAAVRAPGEDRFDLPAATTPQPIADEVLTATADQAVRALAAPLRLTTDDDASLELTPTDLAALIEIRSVAGPGDSTDLELVVTPERVETEIGDIGAGRFDVAPTRAAYRASRTPPTTFDAPSDTTFRPVAADVEVIPGRTGRAFDPELAAEQLTELLREGIREAQPRLAEVETEFSTARAESLRPTHAIGTFTTYYQAGQTRNRNIQLLADVIDGALVLPGEQFSINDISGERSCEKGYFPAGTIVRGELVDTCGGGTSQFGTTTFNAAFFAGVQLDQWKAHSWYISRYPMGREATLSYPQLDVRFTNNTDGAILVKTAHTSTSVTVTLLGVPRATAVSARHSGRSNPRPFTTQYRDTSELVRGQERVVQGGTNGFSVTVQRTVELTGGGNENRTIETVYVPQTRIVERGTAAAPPPPPAEPEDEPDDSGDDDAADDGD